jgi:hypothetical protein
MFQKGTQLTQTHHFNGNCVIKEPSLSILSSVLKLEKSFMSLNDVR